LQLLARGSTFKISHFLGGQGHLSNTICLIFVHHKFICQIASKSVKRFKYSARMSQTTDDRARYKESFMLRRRFRLIMKHYLFAFPGHLDKVYALSA